MTRKKDGPQSHADSCFGENSLVKQLFRRGETNNHFRIGKGFEVCVRCGDGPKLTGPLPLRGQVLSPPLDPFHTL